MPPPTLTNQVIELRTDLGKVRDELHEQGRKLEERLGEIREDFAGFRARVDIVIDDVPKIRDDFRKIRDDFTDFRSSIKTYLVVTGWAVGVFSALSIWMIKSSYDLTWNASQLHADVARHSKDITDLTAAIGKLDERQRPFEALPGLLKSLEETAKGSERIVARLDRFENELRPLMTLSPDREWRVLIAEEDRLKDSAEAGTPGNNPFPANPNLPPDTPDRTLEFGVHLLGSSTSPKIGTLLGSTFSVLPSKISRGIEQVEAIVTGRDEARVRIRFKGRLDRGFFESELAKHPDIILVLRLAAGR